MREGLKEPETPEILHGKQAWDLIQARLKDAWEDMILGPIEHVQGMVDDLRHAKDDYEIGKIVGEQAPQILLRLAINRFRKYHPLDKHYAVERHKRNPDHGDVMQRFFSLSPARRASVRDPSVKCFMRSGPPTLALRAGGRECFLGEKSKRLAVR